MTTGGLIVLIIFYVLYKLSKLETNKKLDNYDMTKVSLKKLSEDAGKSEAYKRAKMVRGGYDKDDEWKI